MRMYTDTDYRRVEAMYHNKYSNEYIVGCMTHLPKPIVLDIIQTIEGRINVRKEREYYAKRKSLT